MPNNNYFPIGGDVLQQIYRYVIQSVTFPNALNLYTTFSSPFVENVTYYGLKTNAPVDTKASRGMTDIKTAQNEVLTNSYLVQPHMLSARVPYSTYLNLKNGGDLAPMNLDIAAEAIRGTMEQLMLNIDKEMYHGTGKGTCGALYEPASGENIATEAAPELGASWEDVLPNDIYNYFNTLSSKIAADNGVVSGPKDLVIPIQYRGAFQSVSQYTLNAYGTPESVLEASGFSITYMARAENNSGSSEQRILLYDKVTTYGYLVSAPIAHGEQVQKGDSLLTPFWAAHAGVNFRAPFLARYIPPPVAPVTMLKASAEPLKEEPLKSAQVKDKASAETSTKK